MSRFRMSSKEKVIFVLGLLLSLIITLSVLISLEARSKGFHKSDEHLSHCHEVLQTKINERFIFSRLNNFVNLEHIETLRMHYNNQLVFVILYKSANYLLLIVFNRDNKLLNSYKLSINSGNHKKDAENFLSKNGYYYKINYS